MRVKEVADRLNISISTVYAEIGAGKMRCTRHGLGRGTIRISEEQLEDYRKQAEVILAPRPSLGSMRL